MGFEWSSSLESTRPLHRSSRCILRDARRVFTSSKNTCYLRSRRPCFSHRSHPGRLVPGGLLVKAVLEALAVCWYYSREAGFNGFPHDGFFGDGIIFVAKTFRIEEEMALNDARRGFVMCLIFHLFLLTSLFSLNVSDLFPFGNNKICISVAAIGLKTLCCNWARIESSSLVLQICVFSFLGM